MKLEERGARAQRDRIEEALLRLLARLEEPTAAAQARRPAEVAAQGTDGHAGSFCSFASNQEWPQETVAVALGELDVLLREVEQKLKGIVASSFKMAKRLGEDALASHGFEVAPKEADWRAASALITRPASEPQLGAAASAEVRSSWHSARGCEGAVWAPRDSASSLTPRSVGLGRKPEPLGDPGRALVGISARI